MLAHWLTTKAMKTFTLPIVIYGEVSKAFWMTWHEVFRYEPRSS